MEFLDDVSYPAVILVGLIIGLSICFIIIQLKRKYNYTPKGVGAKSIIPIILGIIFSFTGKDE